MKINVKFDQAALRREIQAGVDRVAREQTRDLDRLRQQYTGRPAAEIKPALQRLFARYDGKITDPELSEWAQLISDGTRIEMKPGKDSVTSTMSEIDPEYVRHQYLYVPWTDKFDSFALGKALALYVKDHFRARLTVVCPQKSNAEYHTGLAKLPIVTERTGTVADGGVVLAFVPTRKVMAKVHRLSKSIVIMVEDPSERFEAWAWLAGAYNVLTRKVMSAGLSEAGTKALDGVVWEGYNGWHDSIAEMMTTKHLKDLAELGEYDRVIVIEFAAQRKGEHALKRLEKILDRFERAASAVA